MLIACDIGGVVKEMTSDECILDAIISIKQIEKLGHKVIFVSKCKQNFRELLKNWLATNGLQNDAFFCNEYSEKKQICIKEKVDYMIDDKLQVFKDMPDKIKKIWFCADNVKINGAKKYQPDEVSKVVIFGGWKDIVHYLSL